MDRAVHPKSSTSQLPSVCLYLMRDFQERKIIMTSGAKRTFEEVAEIVNNLGYGFIREYSYTNLRRVIFQDNLGYKYDLTLNSLIDGYTPEAFRYTNPFTLENISLWIKRNKKPFELFGENKYVNNSEKLKFYCHKCKDVFLAGWNQILSGSSCAVCEGRQVGKYNNLEYLRPDLTEEWDSENKLKPSEVTISSGQKVMWRCSVCGYRWKSRVADRNSGRGCSACAGQVLSDRNRLSILFPALALEWHSTKNGNLRPYDVSYGSNKQVWWTCVKCGGEWKAHINARTNTKSGCPDCANKLKESRIATFLKLYFTEHYSAIVEYKVLKNPETETWLPFDIYLSHKKLFIEIHGEQHYKLSGWHKLISSKKNITPKEEFEYQKHKDRLKRRFAKKHGTYIEIDLRKVKTTEEAINIIKAFL